MFGRGRKLEERIDALHRAVTDLERKLERRDEEQRAQDKLNREFARQLGGQLGTGEFIFRPTFLTKRNGTLAQQLDAIAEWLDIKFENVACTPEHLRAVYNYENLPCNSGDDE